MNGKNAHWVLSTNGGEDVRDGLRDDVRYVRGVDDDSKAIPARSSSRRMEARKRTVNVNRHAVRPVYGIVRDDDDGDDDGDDGADVSDDDGGEGDSDDGVNDDASVAMRDLISDAAGPAFTAGYSSHIVARQPNGVEGGDGEAERQKRDQETELGVEKQLHHTHAL